MASEARYRLLVDEYESTHYIKVSYIKFALSSLLCPLFAFVFCIVYSLIFNFEGSTSTQCRAYNFLPSISAAIGNYSPQKEVWKFAILVQAIPRFIMATCYVQYNTEVLRSSASLLILLACILNCIEDAALIMLSLFDSSNHYPTHEKSFITFIITSQMYMLLLLFLHSNYREHARNLAESKSFKLKKYLASTNIIGILLATYFFISHTFSCQNYTYTWFALCEYVVVLSNMAFHISAILDFKGRYVVIHSKGLHLSKGEYR